MTMNKNPVTPTMSNATILNGHIYIMTEEATIRNN